MESNQCENKESEELNFRKMKSMSLVSFPKRKKKEEKGGKMFKRYSCLFLFLRLFIKKYFIFTPTLFYLFMFIISSF